MKNSTKTMNYFYGFHPVSLLFYYIFLIAALFTCDYDYTLIYTFASLSLCFIYFKGIRAYIKSFIYYAILILFTGIFNIIFNHSGDHVFLYVNNVPLTFDALFYGMYTGLLVCCLLLWFQSFNIFMDSGKINYLIGRRFHATGLILSMAFSFTDKFVRKVNIIRQTLYTQGLRSVNLKYGAAVFSLLITIMLEDSSVTADSMIARGYLSSRRKCYKKYSFIMKDIILSLTSLIIFLTTLIYRWFILPLVFIPIIYNIHKELLWKYYQSKI